MKQASLDPDGVFASNYETAYSNMESNMPNWPDGYWTHVYGALSDSSFVVPSEPDAVRVEGMEVENWDEASGYNLL